MKASEVRVRFAPSPTGYLHIGGARTAVFNYLFARKHGGKFLLRIEDTDLARSGEDMVRAILEGLQWLGLQWDEPPVYQSSRFEVYRTRARELVDSGKAYFCYCTKEELEEERRRARERGEGYRYSGRCRNLSEAERAAFEAEGRKPVVRLRVREGRTGFHDHVHGYVEIDNEQLDDFVLLRSDGIPTYHLAVVVDDHEMGITHVIRGDDHLSNTPKHVLLYEAFGWELPEFAHVPLILGPDRKRLSKRHGATSIAEYAAKGYLPEAVVNFIALLGWNPGDDREIMSLEELIQAFDLSGISRASAIFDEAKLEWMNGVYIASYDLEKLTEKALPFFGQAFGWKEAELEQRRPYLTRVVELLRLRVRKLSDFPRVGRYFFEDPQEYEAKGVRKHFDEPGVADRLEQLASELAECEPFEAARIEAVLRGLAEKLSLKAAKLIHPARLAVTGVTGGPGLFELFEVLGRDVVVRRLRRAAELIRANRVPVMEEVAV